MVKAIQLLTSIGETIGFLYGGELFWWDSKVKKTKHADFLVRYTNHAKLKRRKEVSNWTYVPIAAVPIMLIFLSLFF